MLHTVEDSHVPWINYRRLTGRCCLQMRGGSECLDSALCDNAFGSDQQARSLASLRSNAGKLLTPDWLFEVRYAMSGLPGATPTTVVLCNRVRTST